MSSRAFVAVEPFRPASSQFSGFNVYPRSLLLHIAREARQQQPHRRRRPQAPGAGATPPIPWFLRASSHGFCRKPCWRAACSAIGWASAVRITEEQHIRFGRTTSAARRSLCSHRGAYNRSRHYRDWGEGATPMREDRILELYPLGFVVYSTATNREDGQSRYLQRLLQGLGAYARRGYWRDKEAVQETGYV